MQEMVQTKKSRPLWKLLKTDCHGATYVLKTPKFFCLEAAHAWLDIKYGYVPRVDVDWQESEFQA